MSHNIEIFGGLRFLQARCYRTVRTPQGRPCKRAGRERDNFLFKFLLVKLHTWRAIQATTLKLLEVITKSEKATGRCSFEAKILVFFLDDSITM